MYGGRKCACCRPPVYFNYQITMVWQISIKFEQSRVSIIPILIKSEIPVKSFQQVEVNEWERSSSRKWGNWFSNPENTREYIDNNTHLTNKCVSVASVETTTGIVTNAADILCVFFPTAIAVRMNLTPMHTGFSLFLLETQSLFFPVTIQAQPHWSW